MTGAFNAVWKLAVGGALFELDTARRVNLLNVMTAPQEGYHDEIRTAAARSLTPEMAEADVAYDEHTMVRQGGRSRRTSSPTGTGAAFIDHSAPRSHVDQFYRMQYGEQGDFVNLAYTGLHAAVAGR